MALRRFIEQEAHYPAEAVAQRLTGKVTLRLVVQADGRVDSLALPRLMEATSLLNEEALRLAKRLPQFAPALRDGKPVAKAVQMELDFQLPE